MSQVRERLIEVMDNETFEPILSKSPDEYRRESDQEKLREAQAATEEIRQRYLEEETAAGIRDRYKGDLQSGDARRVDHELKSLGLPTLEGMEPEFDKSYSITRS
jgi:hypothetical protein